MRPRVNWFVYFAVALLLFAWFRLGGSSPAPNDDFAMLGT